MSLYDALKNSQPIAFLASLAIVIAAFTSSNDKLSSVYIDASIASFTFIFSFICSLAYQIQPKLESPLIDITASEPNSTYSSNREILFAFARYGTYFFLIIGIAYLLLIAYEFGKSHVQLHNIVIGWLQVFFAFVVIVAIFRLSKVKRDTNFKIAKFTKITLVVLVATGVAFGINGAVNVLGGFIDVQQYSTYLSPLMGIMFIGIILIAYDDFVRKRKRK